MAFKAGDTVRLKSGGPLMTVASILRGDAHYAVCQWFEGTTLKQGQFDQEALIEDDGMPHVG